MTSILIESTNSTIEPPHMRINSRLKNLKKGQEIIFSSSEKGLSGEL
jgi:hypothetical protein